MEPKIELGPGSPAQVVFSSSLVMGVIGQALPGADLLTLRQTCTAWNRGFLPHLRVRHTPIQLAKPTLRTTANEVRHKSGQDVAREFMDTIKVSRQIPFTKYRIDNQGNRQLEPRKTLQALLELSGNYITFLDLCWWYTSDLSFTDLRKLIFQEAPALNALSLNFSPYERNNREPEHVPNTTRTYVLVAPTPNLRRFKFVSCCGVQQPEVIEFISDVIQNANGLKYIAIKLRPFDGQDFITEILCATIQTSWGYRIACLQKFKLTVWTSAELEKLVLLSVNGLQLRALSMSVVCKGGFKKSSLDERRRKTSFFYKFLKTQAPSLRKLNLKLLHVNFQFRLQTVGEYYGTPFRLPQMTQLMSLKLARSEQMRIGLVFEGRRPRSKAKTMATTFPALKRFAYRHLNAGHGWHNYKNWNLAKDLSRIPHPTLTKLNLKATGLYLSRFSSSIFPAVRHLGIRAGLLYERDRTPLWTMTQLWTVFPTLTKLHISLKYGGYFNLDQMLSGIEPKWTRSHSTLLGSGETFETLSPTLDDCRAFAYRFHRHARFSDLKQLEEFTFQAQYYNQREDLGLTNHGVYLGLALAGPQLRRVTIIGPPEMTSAVSDRARVFLQSVLGPSAIIKI